MERSLSVSLDKVLMNGIQEMVFVVNVGKDAVFTYELLNQAVLDKTHLDESSIGKTFREVHSQKTAELLDEQYEKTFADCEITIFEDSYFSPSGDCRFSRTRLTPLLSEEGICTHIIGVVQDITNEKLAQQESEEAWKRLEESQFRYRSLFDNNSDAILTLDFYGQMDGGNSAIEKLSGYSMDELAGKSVLDFVVPEDRKLAAEYFQQAKDDIFNDGRINFLTKTGERVGVLIKFSPITVKNEIIGIYLILKDMRELDKMIGKYVESEKRFRIIAENVHDVIVLMSDEGEYLYVSPSSEELYGYENTELIGKPPYYNIHTEDKSLMKENFLQAIEKRQTRKMRLRIKHKTKGWIWSEVTWTPVFNEQNQFVHMVTIARDISMQKEYETQLEYFAYHDPLTELPNRRFFRERLSQKIGQLRENGDNFSVVLLDIDNFKNINDSLGHETGDAVIHEFGKRLSGILGEKDIAARLGGDEFIVLLSEAASEQQAIMAVNKIRNAMEKPWQFEGDSLNVTTSIGIAVVSSKNATASSILKTADNAMYESKESGRNSYRIRRL